MSKDLYTITQKKYLNAKEINELQSIMGDQIILETMGIMNQLKIYKSLKKPGFLDSLFGGNKSQKEYDTCTKLITRSIAILFNSIRFILYDELNKHTTDNAFKEVIQYVGDKLPNGLKFKIKDKSVFIRAIYNDEVEHNFPRSNDSFKKDFQFLKDVYSGQFSQQELISIQKFSSDSWVKLYPHTYITMYKKYFNAIR
jgi:hypothetical protein